MRLRTLDDLKLEGAHALLRVDFNVPMEAGRIVDDTRMTESLPTIRALRDRGASVLLVAHLGRPKGTNVAGLSVAPLSEHLATLVGMEVPVLDWPGQAGAEPPVAQARALPAGGVAMLQNIRFDPREEANDPTLARDLASLADVYVNDAFGAAHRAHASTEGVAHLLPSAAGLLMQREVETLGRVLTNPALPLVAVVGGAKISTKIGVMENLLPRVAGLLVGGAMACTLLRARGLSVGTSKVEEDQLDVATRLLAEGGDRIVLPLDAVVAEQFNETSPTRVVPVEAIPDDWMMLDVGPATVERFGGIVATAGTVVWNGPLGVYEMPPFRAGTEGLARAVAGGRAYSVVGGGDLAAALLELGLTGEIDHLSTGGGATLEFLEGRVLPGVQALEADA